MYFLARLVKRYTILETTLCSNNFTPLNLSLIFISKLKPLHCGLLKAQHLTRRPSVQFSYSGVYMLMFEIQLPQFCSEGKGTVINGLYWDRNLDQWSKQLWLSMEISYSTNTAFSGSFCGKYGRTWIGASLNTWFWFRKMLLTGGSHTRQLKVYTSLSIIF